jgi:hypothetical protein
MKAIPFKEQNIVFGENQEEYLPLPAYYERASQEGYVITCHALTWRERWAVFFTGKVWAMQITFHRPVQPIKLESSRWSLLNREFFKTLGIAVLMLSCSTPEDVCDCRPFTVEAEVVRIATCSDSIPDWSVRQAKAISTRQNCDL